MRKKFLCDFSILFGKNYKNCFLKLVRKQKFFQKKRKSLLFYIVFFYFKNILKVLKYCKNYNKNKKTKKIFHSNALIN